MVDRILKKILLQHTGGPGECAKSAGTFRTAQVTGGGGLNRNGDWPTPLDGLACPFADVITRQHLASIPKTGKSQFGQKIKSIIGIKPGHRAKIKLSC